MSNDSLYFYTALYSTTVTIRIYVTLPYKECMNLSSYMQVTSVALRVIVWETSNGKNTIFRGEVRYVCITFQCSYPTDLCHTTLASFPGHFSLVPKPL